VFAFAADAEQHCEGNVPALHVRIRFNSSVPLVVSAPQSMPGWPQQVSQGQLVTLDGSQSYEPNGHISTWQWSQVAGPRVSLVSRLTPVVTFSAPRVPQGGADLVFKLDVKDNSGNRATGNVSVHVFNPKDRRTLVTFVSPPGDYIGQGMSFTVTPAEGDVTFNANCGQPNACVHFDGGLDWWEADFAAPNGAALLPGTYLGAERLAFASPGRPGLDVYGSGRGCNTLSGQFTVTEYDPTTNPPRFGARFVQSCEGIMPALTGTVLFNAVPPGPAKRGRGAGPNSQELLGSEATDEDAAVETEVESIGDESTR